MTRPVPCTYGYVCKKIYRFTAQLLSKTLHRQTNQSQLRKKLTTNETKCKLNSGQVHLEFCYVQSIMLTCGISFVWLLVLLFNQTCFVVLHRIACLCLCQSNLVVVYTKTAGITGSS